MSTVSTPSAPRRSAQPSAPGAEHGPHSGSGPDAPTAGTRAAKAARRRSGQFPRGVRRAVNSAHVVFAVGLVGVELVMIVLALMARNTGDDAVRHFTYETMHSLVYAAGIPLAALSLVSGVVLCLRTPWGLWKHLWIKVKIVLLFLVIAIGAGAVSEWVRVLEDRSAPGADASGIATYQWLQLGGVGVQITALVVATFLSVYKPSGARRVSGERRGGGAGRG
ncbi:hypothetical protein [Yinghuangia sp. YIM S09857]|uniref:hypothetical protein n=1 Tax=Yinghuangia sp. YIM S09857 TaxID=3436929 RepID=UPI003F52F142